jgi:hypothetical protein
VPGAIWNGTVWKAWAKLRGTRPDLFMCVVDIDEGCGVIRRGRQTCYAPWPPPPEQALSYEFLAANRQRLLNLVSVAEFLRLDEQFRQAAPPRAREAQPIGG